MKLAPEKIGGNPKQYAILGGLVLLALISYLLNRNPSGPPASAQQVRPAAVQDPITPPKSAGAKRPADRTSATRRGEEFRPTLKLPEGMDVSKIDPTIKLALLEKVRNVKVEVGPRGSVFAFGNPPPPPPPPKPKVILNPTEMTKANPTPEPPKAPADPPKPAPPPIPLKFFGYATRGGAKRAFFLETQGDDIDVAGENDVIKNRYKVIQIRINSVVVEDLNFKSQQTLPLVEELAG